MGKHEEPVEVEVKLVRETEKAILVEVEETAEEVWLPRSQIEDLGDLKEPGDTGKIAISKWIAEQKGLDAL